MQLRGLLTDESKAKVKDQSHFIAASCGELYPIDFASLIY